MKYKLNKAEFDALSPEMQKLYSASGGDYILQVEGMPKPDDSGLIKNRDDLLSENKKLKADKAAIDAEKQAAADELLRKAGDFDKLEQGYKDKIAKMETEHKTALESRDLSLKNHLVNNAAIKMAHDIATDGSADLLLPHIKSRLTVTQNADGEHVTAVLDAGGGASILTVDDLAKEFQGNKMFAPVIAANKANGGGATGGLGGGGATDKKPEDYTEEERMSLYKESPEQFNKIFN